jgi:hypothetical protein
VCLLIEDNLLGVTYQLGRLNFTIDLRVHSIKALIQIREIDEIYWWILMKNSVLERLLVVDYMIKI